MPQKNKIEPGLYIVATPIGNIEDITLRALEVIKFCDFIICEDTRNSIKILNYYKLKKKLIAFHKFNEKKNIQNIIDEIKENKIIALLTDAGTPLVSDPGSLLVEECYNQNIKVFPIPGPSAVTSALSVSGFDTSFYFHGFLPKKINECEKIFIELKKIKTTLVFFLPARDLKKIAKSLIKHFPNSEFLIAREMTKIYESYIRDKLEHFEKYLDNNNKGEVTLLIKNNETFYQEQILNLDSEIKKLMNKMSSKDLSIYLSNKFDISKNEIYKKIINLQHEK